MSIIRKTKTVDSLIKFFNQSKDPITISELVDEFDGVMNKSTVYRILERLENSNILHSFMDSEGLRRYAKLNNQNTTSQADIHPHFVCNQCGDSSCLPVKISIPPIPSVAR